MASPDPTIDLHWGDYRGAIHEIFAKNARAFPDRECVVETKSSQKNERSFTYRQIHEASNLLAHHFLSHGCKVGDVVMIYAYRGVELVVAYMGALKAGATVSVIDPQYPPERQTVLLDVAKPRFLVCIEKANEEFGPPSDLVLKFASDNLSLKSTIPALELLDNGELRGGFCQRQRFSRPLSIQPRGPCQCSRWTRLHSYFEFHQWFGRKTQGETPHSSRGIILS
ncbi:uncharacterized protein TrAtP1_008832 [Trichoderma atroviride]|uniref:uncharacterized protein n=1 Tax=Hypocrea atroviridis TaxID=63577 RepID=UPI003317F029|nr:hypothetical protein TrAtP1_008832 [Trichoderma atroviride]